MYFYHGEKVWNIPVNFTQSLELPDEYVELLRKYIPDYSYVLYDLKDQDINRMIASLSLKAILYIMKNIWKMNSESEIEQLFITYRDLFQNNTGIKIIEKLLIYFYSNTEIEPDTEKQAISMTFVALQGYIIQNIRRLLCKRLQT